MNDIWSFLLQTLTASGVAALLLVVKAMFRDKLSPRWQFAVWGVLGVILLLPAGWGGRHVLMNWPFVVEWLKSTVTGEFGTLAHVIAPIPLPRFAVPETAADWLYLVYLAGVVVLLARYLVSYICLRQALKKGRPVQDERVKAVAERYHLPACPAVEVDGLPTAFICGVVRPVLALPAGVETDEKVILHELLHRKNKDVAWGLVICFFRCIHWCNPLIWLCADWADNDLESLCDQRVLERLEGEDRRDYGRILLSMADEKYARAPGTSSAANGGKNIARRIQAIARFKRYPAGMALVSVCVALVLALPLVVGTRAEAYISRGKDGTIAMAQARTTYCTTCAGAFDTYAKAVIEGNLYYRAMCAPLSQQNELAAVIFREDRDLLDEWSYFGLDMIPARREQPIIYNLTPVGEDVWEGLLVLPLDAAPEGETWDSSVNSRWLTVQTVRAEKEGARWVVVPQEEFRTVQGDARIGGNLGLPAKVYEAQYGDFTIRVRFQTTTSIYGLQSYNQSYNAFGNGWSSYTITWSYAFDPTPKPNGMFYQGNQEYRIDAVYTGDPGNKENYTHIAVAAIPIYGDEYRQPVMDLEYLHSEASGSNSSTGNSWGSRLLDKNWDNEIFIDAGGGSESEIPDAYAAELYLNGELAAELTLLPVEGGEWIEPGA